MNSRSPVTILTKRGGEEGGRLGYPWSVTKSVTKQNVKPWKFISENFVFETKTRNFNLDFTRATPLVALRMVNFSPKRNATYMSKTLFPSPLSLFTSTPRVCTGRLSYSDVITKFSGIDRFPFSKGMVLRCARSANT